MISNEIIVLSVLFTMFGTVVITLFRMIDSKQDKLDEDVARAYEHLSKYTLNPILGQIFASKKGKYTPNEFFNTSEVIMKLEEYRSHLFKFNKVSEMKKSIRLH